MARKKTLDKNSKEIIKSYGRTLKNSGYNVAKLVVFGSYAKGTQKSYSDIDLCVISKDFGKNYFNEMINLNLMKNAETSIIEPHPLNPVDFGDSLNPLACEVKRYGIELKI